MQNKHGMLMHGTFLYDCDLETMVRAITPSDEKLVSKGVDSVRSRVTNLKPYLNGMTQEQLIKHFENTLTFKTYELSEQEIKKIEKMAQKYESNSWIYKKQPPHTKMLKKRITGGLIEVMIDLHDGVIKNFKILGDFFDTKPLEDFEKLFIGKEYTKKTIKEIFELDSIDDYILDIKKDEFIALLNDGVLIDE